MVAWLEARSERLLESEVIVRNTLALAGIEVGGAGPADLRVNDKRFYERVLTQGGFGLGQSYMDGWWDCDRIDQLIYRILEEDLTARVPRGWRTTVAWLRAQVMNLQTTSRAAQVAHVHYDLGNDFFAAMLGRTMTYSCEYWPEATELDEAQERKLDLICRKLDLQPGDQVLDVGCGWGGFARWAAERVGARVTGVTVSAPQAEFAHERLVKFARTLDVRRADRGQIVLAAFIGVAKHDRVAVGRDAAVAPVLGVVPEGRAGRGLRGRERRRAGD